MSLESLPSELHVRVLQTLDHVGRRRCLGVNRAWHQLALPLVFRSINIYLEDSHTLRPGNANLVSDNNHTTSEELLMHLPNNHILAKVVKMMTVHHYYLKPKEPPLHVWHQAFAALVNLECFQWLGKLPEVAIIPPDAKCLNPLLIELLIPSNFPVPEAWKEGLKTLKFDANNLYSRNNNNWPLIRANIQTLQTLAVCGLDFLRVSCFCLEPRSRSVTTTFLRSLSTDVTAFAALKSAECWYTNLTSLDLFFCTEGDFSSAIMAQFQELKHLAIHTGSSRIDAFFTVESFQEWGQFFPNLVSFKLISDYEDHPKAHYETLAAFIIAHPLLVRLDLEVQGVWHAMSIILPAISQLKMLRVLGFDPGFHINPKDARGVLLKCVPTTLTSLKLVFWWSTSYHYSYTADFFNYLVTFPNLGFLYLSHSNISDFAMSEHVRRLTSIRCLGYHDDIWSVNHHPTFSTLRWSKEKINRRRVEDFDDEDHEWLLRYRVLRP